MSEDEWVRLADVPDVADERWLYAVGNGGLQRPWRSEPWAHFRDRSDEEPRWLIEGLLPEGALAFIAAPPKKGKTWVALALALCIASGQPLLGEYEVPEPRNVLYVALEGSRSALRARIGALARGMYLDPDSEHLAHLHMLYRPRPLDLSKPEHASWLLHEQEEVKAAFVVVDVLRAAARIRENVAEDFALVRDALDPMLDKGCTCSLLHHFGKLSETQKERMPGERMAGTGAMYGALDVGLMITRSENGARRLRVDIEARDFATPEALGVVIQGSGSGTHGGFTYLDTARVVLDASAAEERDLAYESEEMFEDGVWRTLEEVAVAIKANKDELRKVLIGAPERFSQVHGKDVGRHSSARPWGTVSMRSILAQIPEPAEPAEPAQGQPALPGVGGSPYGVAIPEPPTSEAAGSGSEPPSQLSDLDDGIPF